jgi:Fe-S-cluster containining protein
LRRNRREAARSKVSGATGGLSARVDSHTTKIEAKSVRMPDQPWYHDGLKFKCTRCGNCCTGAPGFVWVNAEEVTKIARYLGESEEKVARKYVRRIGVRHSLKEHANGDCVFYSREGRGCSIYPARPRQCRTWPFWNSNLAGPEAWQETCRDCPGAGRGDFFSLEEIRAQAALINV